MWETFPLIMFGNFADIDQDWKGHRNWLTHSSILTAGPLAWYAFVSPDDLWFFMTVAAVQALHLIMDMKFDHTKGTYCIVKPRKKWNGERYEHDRMEAGNSTLWLGLNGLPVMVLFTIWLIIKVI